MNPVLRPLESAEYLTEERCRILELSNHPDDPALSVARARVAPGVSTRWHRLRGIRERYLILSGEGLVEIGEAAPQRVIAGDLVQIEPLQAQRITNTGPEDLLFLALCTPRFVWDAYEDIEPAC